MIRKDDEPRLFVLEVHLPSEHVDGRFANPVRSNRYPRTGTDTPRSGAGDQEDWRTSSCWPGRAGEQGVSGLVEVQRAAGVDSEGVEEVG
jgi:hypothetical protein